MLAAKQRSQPGAARRFLEFFTVNIRMKRRWWLRLLEKNGKLNEMPWHHKLEKYLDACIKAARIASDRKGPLFRSPVGKTAQLTDRRMLRGDVWRMVRRRASDAGIKTAIRFHTFRATGITDNSRIAGVSRSRGVWPGTRARKPRAFMTGATMTSASGKSRGSGFENFRNHDAGCVTLEGS